MAEAIIALVVETIDNLLIEEGKFLHGVRDQAEQLHAELKRMVWFLKDADSRQNEADRVREWVSQIRDLAYEAENLLEHYAFKVDSRRERGVTSIIKRCVCLLDECFTRHQVGSEIESLKAKISDLTTSFDRYGIRAIMEREGGSSSRLQQLRRTHSRVAEEEDLVGVESQVEMLAENLIGENYRLISIWGMGGLGKTTLTRKVYQHPKVRGHFEAFLWICVSQQWQTRDLLQGIITKFMPEKRDLIEKWRDEELVREIFEFQQNRKSLIVLDDIWSTDAWESIKDAFPIRENGSKVLLTTRNSAVATHINGGVLVYQPPLLSKENSWELFQKKALIQRRTQVVGFDEIHKMEELGKEMVEHCGGLPLGVLVLGGILATKHSLKDWEIVHKNIKSYLGKGNKIEKDQGRLHSILALSYNDLPYQLKPCFLYLSKYLEDADIETESLYQVWMAEGMVSADDQFEEETLMDVAERYLEELAERCMVIVEMEENMPSIRRFKSCRLHDLMREMCLPKAKDENFLELIDYNVAEELLESSFVTSRSTRLTIHMGLKDVRKYVAPRKEVTQRLRSFCFSIDGEYYGRMKFQFDDFRMLRVLSIEGLVPDLSKASRGERFLLSLDHISFPRAIGKLIHLRYLSLRNSAFFIIPSSISKLKHLQTLDLRCKCPTRIPNAIQKLERLKHLYLPDYQLVLCKFSRLNGLHNLEILENFHSGRSTDIKVLSTLTKLRSLKARVRNKLEDVDEFIDQVNNLIYLRFFSLEIRKCDFCSEEGKTLLRKVFSWSRLNDLVIDDGRISKLPEYEPCFLQNLHTLTLWWTRMDEDPMRTLEKLPNLKTLYLYENSFTGEDMICHATGFPQLKSLKLYDLRKLNNWLIEEGAMPNLSHLEIRECRELKKIPDGLRFVTTLKELRIFNMPQEFKSRLQVKDDREGEDFDKVRHVLSIIFW